jgi:hypothetical protein
MICSEPAHPADRCVIGGAVFFATVVGLKFNAALFKGAVSRVHGSEVTRNALPCQHNSSAGLENRGRVFPLWAGGMRERAGGITDLVRTLEILLAA